MFLTHHARFLAALVLLIVLPCLGCSSQEKNVPVAERGVLDLSGWDIVGDGPVALDGQWAFYWDRLLAPEDFKPDLAPPHPSGFMDLPGTWKGQMLHGQPLSGQGQATFRLRLLPEPGVRQLALRLISIHAAYRLWADGKLVAQSGEPGRSSATETPHRSLVLARVASQGKPIDLVLQVSNHTFRRGGLLYPILLGLPNQLELIHSRIWSWGMFFVGSLLIMIVYHLVLYFLKRKESSTLYFSLDCLLLICYYVTSDPSDWLINLFILKTDPGILQKISVISYPVMSSVVYRFYRSLYPVEFLRFIQNLCDLRNVAFILIVLTQSNLVIYTALYWFALSTVIFNCYFLVMLIICVRRGRDGASFLLLGYLSFSAATLSEIYGHIISFFEGSILLFGFLAFVLFQALALAQRFANAFTAVENLSADLRTEMDERTRLEREIINVSEEERRRLSHDLHDGLCQQLVGTRVRCAALARSPIAERGVAEEVTEIASLLTDSVGQAYDLSRGLWPVELAPGEVGSSLAELARRVGRTTGIAVQYREHLSCSPCRNEHLVQLYRIAQESVTNAVKHAQPGRIAISLDCGLDRRLTLAVADDGIGRRAAAGSPGGLGLRIMAYRARMIGARLSIDDAEAGGTRVVCSLACLADKTSEDADG
ncbi:MAG: sensor histidine kinase [Solidesulfovibrio sp.]|jgi:signal transduction histidine kinase|uniref:sensor histidine kinase n=1 Tax=Solidesulfovibrio sp. TaxID=2910990 RepID=UPI002B2177B7|nr:sensor histidine kinase [Solidesulfovibrio sp.]MEA4856167.1 sensor histidine kinase [Solidesulfovibrio sp.]